MARKGSLFKLVDQTFLTVAVHNAHPLAAVREAVKNGQEAGATFIDLYSSPKGAVVISDNGHGMSARELERYMEGLGSGSKARGREANMGVGLKAVAAVQNPSGTVITSWKRGAEKAHRIILGEIGEGQYGIIDQDGSAVKEVSIPVSIRGNRHSSGTMVELRDTQFRPYVVRRFLNDRFLFIAPNHEIAVWHDVSGKKEALSVDGTLDCLRKVCRETGSVKLNGATMHWGIRRELSSPEAQASFDAILSNQFTGASVYYGWNGESYRHWEYSRGGRMKLGSFGIRSGAKEVYLVIEAQDTPTDLVSPSIDRQSISGWDEDATQTEALMNMPTELLEFMSAWERAHFDAAFETGMVDRLLREMAPPPVVRGREQPPTTNVVLGPSSNGKGSHPSDRNRPNRTHVKARGYPSFAYVDGEELETVPVVYDPVTHRILINRDHSVLAFLDGASNEKVRTEARAWVAAQLINAFSLWVADRGTEPEEDHLLAALGGAVGTAQLKVRFPTRFSLPKATGVEE